MIAQLRLQRRVKQTKSGHWPMTLLTDTVINQRYRPDDGETIFSRPISHFSPFRWLGDTEDRPRQKIDSLWLPINLLPHDAMLARYTVLWSCLFVSPLDISRYFMKTAEERVTESTPYVPMQGLWFSDAKDFSERNSDDVTPSRAPNIREKNLKCLLRITSTLVCMWV